MRGLEGDPTELLATAFPWGAHVTLRDAGEFISLRYEVVGETGDGATIRFERDPGDTLQELTAAELMEAARTGAVQFDGCTLRQPEPRDLHLLADPLRDFVGPQATETGWIRRMRLHQSWWRTFRLRCPFGAGPRKSSTTPLGSMLDDAGAAAGRNFLSSEAQRSYEDRLVLSSVGVDSWRTERNLLASQPMAFNLFGHLRHNLDLATQLFHSLLGDDEVAEVTDLEIERLSDTLGDKTAFDAFVIFRTGSGGQGCVAIETKLTEPFSQQSYDWQKYLAHEAFTRDVWDTDDAAVLGHPRWSQLWRNHLLARAESARYRFEPATLLVVHHPEDSACAANVGAYGELLKDPRTVRSADLRAIVDALRPLVAGQPDQEAWISDLHDRYVDLTLSDALVSALQR